MKKLFFIAFAFLLLNVTIAQESTATKEETMEWIAGKFREILVPPRTFHGYSDGVFIYDRHPEGEPNYTVYVDLKKVTDIKTQTHLICDGHTISLDNLGLKGKGIVSYNDHRPIENSFNEADLDNEDDCKARLIFILDIKSVNGLRTRLEKALEHLVQLNVGKNENEKF